MPSYDIRPLQQRLLDILITIDKVCQEHQIRYYLVAGTMLGAVRHQGFIPWDDDVDIAMPRLDYDRFMQHSAEWLPQPYEALCAQLQPDFPSDFAKVVDSSTTLIEREHHSYLGGIYVDVFPIDHITSNPLLQRCHFLHYALLKKLIYLLCRDPYKHGRGPSSWLPRFCQHWFSLPATVQRLIRLQQTYNNQSCHLVVDHDFGHRGIMPPAVYGTPKAVMFEGHRLMGVALPQQYLSAIYGDYMTIPSGDRQRQHNFFYLNYELPYRQYHDNRPFVSSKH